MTHAYVVIVWVTKCLSLGKPEEFINCLPIVMSPTNLASSHTTADELIFNPLLKKQRNKFTFKFQKDYPDVQIPKFFSIYYKQRGYE